MQRRCLKVKEQEERRMHTISIPMSKIRRILSEVVKRAAYGKQHFAITVQNKNVAAIIPYEELTIIEQIKEVEDRLDARDTKAALAEARKNGTVSLSELEKELGL